MEFQTAARHSWQKSARRIDVVCLGNKTKTVIAYDVVTSVDDACSLHHESLGTMRIYEKLDQQGVVVGIRAHDNNASISKYIQCSCKVKKDWKLSAQQKLAPLRMYRQLLELILL